MDDLHVRPDLIDNKQQHITVEQEIHRSSQPFAEQLPMQVEDIASIRVLHDRINDPHDRVQAEADEQYDNQESCCAPLMFRL